MFIARFKLILSVVVVVKNQAIDIVTFFYHGGGDGTITRSSCAKLFVGMAIVATTFVAISMLTLVTMTIEIGVEF